MTDLAIVLAAGRGSRLQKASPDVNDRPCDPLAPAQEAAVQTGIKALMPVGPPDAQRPIIDYILAGLVDAGIREVCLVIQASCESAFASHFKDAGDDRLTVRYAYQHTPRGTADALLAARRVVGARPFLVLGCDTWMPAGVLQRVIQSQGCAMPAFDRARLLADDTNLDDDKVRGFAILDLSDPAGDGVRRLERVREKPDRATWEALAEPVYLSLNAWRFDASIFDACGAIAPSPRGELELPDAVQHLIEHGTPISALPTESPALDLTHRSDAHSFGRLIGNQLGTS